ncbi:hypothetical protein [uncultured Brachyspira sp.]|uniref:hypothetical protein n=1 Tax=uncultured Brachyspira sp. TaxID=221953 RepID=UPI00261EDBD8|nr:hypothetical protein [uncultured Brachyspira sp.]
MKYFILIILSIIFSASCFKNSQNTVSYEDSYYEDIIQVDSPNSFIPLKVMAAPPKNAKNSRYFIINKNIAESSFDYMNNSYIYRASKDSNALLYFYKNYTNNSKKNFIIEDKYKINANYYEFDFNEKFILWEINDIYYLLYTKAKDDKDLTNLSSSYIKSVMK